MKRFDALTSVIILSLAGLLIFVWYDILFTKSTSGAGIYFLDVGQGDAELLLLPQNIKILTDAGPDQKILQTIEKVLPRQDRYIDIAVISHPQSDHFRGFNYLLDNYRFGAFIFNGRSDSQKTGEWQNLFDKIKAQKIPLITLARGDKISYRENQIEFLSPSYEFIQSAAINDTALVELIKTPAFKALLTSDIDVGVENYLVKNNIGLRADILKVSHHGSKYSSSGEFIEMVKPKLAIIEVGIDNKYGHPTKEALARLKSIISYVFRTDQNGTIEIVAENQKLKVYTEK